MNQTLLWLALICAAPFALYAIFRIASAGWHRSKGEWEFKHSKGGEKND